MVSDARICIRRAEPIRRADTKQETKGRDGTRRTGGSERAAGIRRAQGIPRRRQRDTRSYPTGERGVAEGLGGGGGRIDRQYQTRGY